MLTEKQERAKLKEKFLETGVPEEVAELVAQTLPIGGGDAWMSPEQRAKAEQLQLKALEQQKMDKSEVSGDEQRES